MKSKNTAEPPKRRPRRAATGPEATLARHRAQCQICRHAQRDEIEREFLDWVPASEIAQEYKLGSHRAVYRHAHALGLFRARRGHVQRALDKIIERSGEVKITGASIVAAIRLLVELETSFEKRSTLAHLRKTAKENGETRVPNDEEDFEEDRLPARPAARAGARPEDEPDGGEEVTGSAIEIFRELETAHGLEPLPSSQAALRSPASPKSKPNAGPATNASGEGQFKVKSSQPSAPIEKKPPAPSVQAEPSPALAPSGPEPGTRQEPDGPPNVAGMAWWPNGRSPFARRGRWGRRPVVG